MDWYYESARKLSKMEIKKDAGNQELKEDILMYLLKHGKENKYRLVRIFKAGTEEIIAALTTLENEEEIVMEWSNVKSMKKGLEGEAEEPEEVEPPTEVEEAEAGIESDLTDMK